MIVYLTQGMTRLALRVKEAGDRRQLTDWRLLQLLIQPGQIDTQGCGPNGSPWILTGCWPGKRTDVDVANPVPFDFPTICYDAFELDADGRIVFRLDEKFWHLPTGRYTGILRVFHQRKTPLNMLPYVNLGRKPAKPGVAIPPEYLVGQNCEPVFPSPPPPPIPALCCVLTTFDIDLGPTCSDHMVDQVAVNFAISTCGEEHGEA